MIPEIAGRTLVQRDPNGRHSWLASDGITDDEITEAKQIMVGVTRFASLYRPRSGKDHSRGWLADTGVDGWAWAAQKFKEVADMRTTNLRFFMRMWEAIEERYCGW